MIDKVDYTLESILIQPTVPPVCVINIGLPGSGKSMYTQKFIHSDPDHPLNIQVISSDNLITMEALRTGKSYDQVWKDCIQLADQRCKEMFKMSVACGDNIIIDRTNITASARKKWLDGLPKDYEKVAIYYHIEDPFKVTRLGKRIPVGTLARMKREIQMPTKEEGFDLILMTGDMGETFSCLYVREGLQDLAEEFGVVV